MWPFKKKPSEPEFVPYILISKNGHGHFILRHYFGEGMGIDVNPAFFKGIATLQHAETFAAQYLENRRKTLDVQLLSRIPK